MVGLLLDNNPNSAMKPKSSQRSKHHTTTWYTICLLCSAKFYSPHKPEQCPRCGHQQFKSTRAVCPWRT